MSFLSVKAASVFFTAELIAIILSVNRYLSRVKRTFLKKVDSSRENYFAP